MTWTPHATVAVIVEDQEGRFLVVEETSGGRVVFNQPAGHVEEDEAILDAVKRETLEETGMNPRRHGRFLIRLSDLVTRHHSRWRPMVVTPYVYEWQGPQSVSLNHEVQRVVWVPLAYLAAEENQSRLPWRTPLGTLNMPCCRYQGYCIWGLSYSMLKEFLALETK